jgi:hypothetical protein
LALCDINSEFVFHRCRSNCRGTCHGFDRSSANWPGWATG